MKHLITYPSSRNNPAAAGVQSRFNAMMELTPLQDFLEDLTERFHRVMKAGDYARLLKLGRLLRKARLELERAKAHNFKTGLKATMLRRRAWREKVLADLGGEPALQVWERKAAKAADRAVNPGPYTPPVYKHPPLMTLRLGQYKLPPRRTPFDVKTDASGCFRLAPVPNPRPKRPETHERTELTWQQETDLKEARHLRARWRLQQEFNEPPVDEATLTGYWYKDEATNTIHRITPIPLLPDELRGVGIEDEDGSPAPSPNNPPETPLGLPDYTQNREHKTCVIRPAARPHEAKPKMRDLGSKGDGDRKVLSTPKSQRSTSALQGRDPRSAACGLVRDDNESNSNDNTYVEGTD